MYNPRRTKGLSKKMDQNKIFAVYKPVGITSHDVVAIIRRKTGVKRVGHGGTLDPLAEGVLVVAVGRENTKLLDKYVKGDKEYVATLKLGYTSDTDDREGPIHEYKRYTQNAQDLVTKHTPTEDDVLECIKKFTGNIMQTPPIYSAIKIGGLPAHRRVRKGQTVVMQERPVKINSIIIDHYSFPELRLKIECGTGVYIRSLARDIGEKLQTGAYLKKLVRTRVGEFKIEESVRIEDLS